MWITFMIRECVILKSNNVAASRFRNSLFHEYIFINPSCRQRPFIYVLCGYISAKADKGTFYEWNSFSIFILSAKQKALVIQRRAQVGVVAVYTKFLSSFHFIRQVQENHALYEQTSYNKVIDYHTLFVCIISKRVLPRTPDTPASWKKAEYQGGHYKYLVRKLRSYLVRAEILISINWSLKSYLRYL